MDHFAGLDVSVKERAAWRSLRAELQRKPVRLNAEMLVWCR